MPQTLQNWNILPSAGSKYKHVKTKWRNNIDSYFPFPVTFVGHVRLSDLRFYSTANASVPISKQPPHVNISLQQSLTLYSDASKVPQPQLQKPLYCFINSIFPMNLWQHLLFIYCDAMQKYWTEYYAAEMLTLWNLPNSECSMFTLFLSCICHYKTQLLNMCFKHKYALIQSCNPLKLDLLLKIEQWKKNKKQWH